MSIEFLIRMRREEARQLREHLPPPPARLIDLGAGAGAQARFLSEAGYRVVAVDVPGSVYLDQQICPVMQYDGCELPLRSGSVDVVYTSHVVEHVRPELHGRFHDEVRRVLKPDGFVIHVVPTLTWRLWTTLMHYPSVPQRLVARLVAARSKSPRAGGGAGQKKGSLLGRLTRSILIPSRHGERGNVLGELWLFSRWAWRRHFVASGWRVETEEPAPFFCTGYCVLGGALPLPARRALGRVLGRSGRLFVLVPAGRDRT